jgi:hypothetical protein
VTQPQTNNCRGSYARLFRYLALFRVIAGTLAALALFTQTLGAQATPGELRSRADYLANAAERCQQRVNSGELDECSVIVTWENNREISIQEAAGVVLRDDRRSCANKVQYVFRSAGSGLRSSALSCVAGCLGNGLTVRGCLSSCGIAAAYPTQVLEKAVQETNSCLEQALFADKRRRENCKR